MRTAVATERRTDDVTATPKVRRERAKGERATKTDKDLGRAKATSVAFLTNARTANATTKTAEQLSDERAATTARDGTGVSPLEPTTAGAVSIWLCRCADFSLTTCRDGRGAATQTRPQQTVSVARLEAAAEAEARTGGKSVSAATLSPALW